MKIFFTVLSIAALLFFSSCDLFNNEPELPPITAEGKGTFGCLVNGKLFLNEGVSGYGNGLYAELQTATDVARIVIYSGNSSTKQNLILSIRDKPTLQVGKVYDLSDSIFLLDYTEYKKIPSCSYRTAISGNVKLLKFDVTNASKIIAGTFEFTASSIDCKDTITVTQGRFDISDVQ